MSTARRTVLPSGTNGSHAGLLLARYMEHAPESEPYKRSKGRVKKELLEATINAVSDRGLQSLYRSAFDRWREDTSRSAIRCVREFKIDSRIIIGLGGTNVTETGLTLHHTYGVPYLPGSALKGLALRTAMQLAGSEADKTGFSSAQQNVMFGTSGEGGLVDFCDGWLLPESLTTCLLPDVMTPHHGKYYMADADNVPEPTDFDNPVPVAMLSVQGTFEIAITARHPEMTDVWLQTAMQFLAISLKQLGIGAKTSSGYGRMSLVLPSNTAIPAPIP